ncbi:MAG: VWA domain-containing protein [Saprospiraceae bacterium]|nr:VWA domain-containing protein [Saprospiraceae bacterium]
MFRFEEPSAFYLLLLIPVLGGIYLLSKKNLQKRIIQFGQPALISKLINGHFSENNVLVLTIGAILCLIIAAANPQYGLKKDKVKVNKSDIFIALDISNSMNATDISPSRLEKSKRFASQLIESRKGDQLGLILFAGGAYLQMPLTLDYAAADLFARSANTDMAGSQGTAIGEAIDLAMRSAKEKNQRALIIISDGEDHDEDAIQMAEKATEAGWSVFTVGAGTPEGGYIPVINAGREEFKMDDEGNPVKTVLNKDLLQKIADAGKGQFYLLNDKTTDIISDLNTKIDQLQKHAVEVRSYSEYRSFYQYFLIAGIFLLLISYFMVSNPKR